MLEEYRRKQGGKRHKKVTSKLRKSTKKRNTSEILDGHKLSGGVVSKAENPASMNYSVPSVSLFWDFSSDRKELSARAGLARQSFLKNAPAGFVGGGGF